MRAAVIFLVCLVAFATALGGEAKLRSSLLDKMPMATHKRLVVLCDNVV